MALSLFSLCHCVPSSYPHILLLQKLFLLSLLTYVHLVFYSSPSSPYIPLSAWAAVFAVILVRRRINPQYSRRSAALHSTDLANLHCPTCYLEQNISQVQLELQFGKCSTITHNSLIIVDPCPSRYSARPARLLAWRMRMGPSLIGQQ